jgi:hypothetical protein
MEDRLESCSLLNCSEVPLEFLSQVSTLGSMSASFYPMIFGRSVV